MQRLLWEVYYSHTREIEHQVYIGAPPFQERVSNENPRPEGITSNETPIRQVFETSVENKVPVVQQVFKLLHTVVDAVKLLAS